MLVFINNCRNTILKPQTTVGVNIVQQGHIVKYVETGFSDTSSVQKVHTFLNGERGVKTTPCRLYIKESLYFSSIQVLLRSLRKVASSQRVLNDLSRTRLSRPRLIWLPPPLVSKLFLFVSLPVCRWPSFLTGMDHSVLTAMVGKVW